jgi:predicted GNAT family acetyltransferase
VEDVIAARATAGHLRLADHADRDILIEWLGAFQRETGGGLSDIEPTVNRRLRAGQLWIWEDTDVVSFAGVTDPVSGVARVGPVYTPPDRRSCGYASALVCAVSSAVRVQGYRCILYTDLANPTSNSIYRSLGYRAVDEVLRYEFG